MKWTNALRTPPALTVRVLVVTRDKFTTFAKRVLTADGKHAHWVDDQSKPVYGVVGWAFVSGTAEVE
jgi:hypothetical protein